MTNQTSAWRGAIAVAIAVSCTAGIRAADTHSTPVSERIQQSETVVVATARHVEATWKPGPSGDQIIVTRVLLEVAETLKGTSEPSRWLEVPGGTLGGVTLRVSDEAVVHEGDRGVFFLDPAQAGIHAPHGKAEALLRLDGRDMVKGTAIRLDDIRRVAAANP